MRKEKLLAEKRSIAEGMPWYVRFSDGELKAFSRAQLYLLRAALTQAEKYRESCDPWKSLDVHRAMRKPLCGEPEVIVDVSGRDAAQVTREYIAQTAASSILRDYDCKKGAAC